MCLVIIISALASPLALFNLRFLSEYYAFLNPVLSMAITTQVIKIVTCISLIWGLIKVKIFHLYSLLFSIKTVFLFLGEPYVLSTMAICTGNRECSIIYSKSLYTYYWNMCYSACTCSSD